MFSGFHSPFPCYPLTMYRPLTSVPFRKTPSFAEIPPCPALSGTVCCFWGGEGNPCIEEAIPDSCVDIIYRIRRDDGRIDGGFAGTSDCPVPTHSPFGEAGYSTFAIRFFSWSAYLFSDDTLSGTLNSYSDPYQRFSRLDRRLREIIRASSSFPERIAMAERLLLAMMDENKRNRRFDRAISLLLDKPITITGLASECAMSTRQLERMFDSCSGISPKNLSSVIRFQRVWQDLILKRDFDPADTALRYGYADQPHMLREFRKHMGRSMGKAREDAFKDVGIVQYSRMR